MTCEYREQCQDALEDCMLHGLFPDEEDDWDANGPNRPTDAGATHKAEETGGRPGSVPGANEPFGAATDAGSGTSAPPPYLMSAMLAGLYELPPMHILRHQTGWGRRVRYARIERLVPRFAPVERLALPSGLRMRLDRACLTRYAWTTRGAGHSSGATATATWTTTEAADFYVYRAKIEGGEEARQDLNVKIISLCLDEEKTTPDGLIVSNAGGSWHGQPNFFAPGSGSAEEEQARSMLHKLCSLSVSAAEKHDRARPSSSLHSPEKEDEEEEDVETAVVKEDKEDGSDLHLDLGNTAIECWANISRSGAWNRLHTHKGSAWSGVYYASAGPTQRHPWGGRLVFKPSPHPREEEDGQALNEQDRRHLRHQRLVSPKSCPLDVGKYIDLDCVEGQMLIFPGWLHHCVLPSDFSTNDGMPRLSIAFNVNWAKNTM